MDTNFFIARIRDLIANDDLPAALQQIRDLLDNSPKLDEAIIQAARFQDIRKQIRLGTISQADASLTQNRIRAGLLDLLREIETQSAKPDVQKEMEQAISLINNKNTVIGSSFSAGRDVHLGDRAEHHYYQYPDRKIPKILGNAPFIPDLFIGRDGELETVHRKLFEDNNLLLLVNGQGGIGKTTLAAKYWQRYEGDYAHLAWVFAQNSILDALLLLSLPLGISYPEQMPDTERLEHLLLEMRRLQKPCLLIIDNANNLDDLKNYYVALRSCPNFHLLLTTRITKFEKADYHEIKPLEADDALKLFISHYEQHDPADDALFHNIFAAVGHNTLVVELLAKNLARHNNELETRYTLADLLADLKGKGLFALTHSEPVRTAYQAKGAALREEKPEAIIGAMYELGQLPPQEIAMLSALAVLPAENIPFDILKKLFPDTEGLDRSLLDLAQKGWIDFHNPSHSFKISPVIQEVVKSKSDDILSICRPLIKALIRELDSEVLHIDNYKHSARYVRYAETVVGFIEKEDSDVARLCLQIGNFYINTGDLSKAMQAFQKMAHDLQQILSTDPANPDLKNGLAVAYEKLGDLNTSIGNLELSLIFFERSNQIAKKLSEYFPQKMFYKNNLAISCSKLGDTHALLDNLEQALTFFEQYNLLEKELFKTLPQNIVVKNNLAISYERLGNIHKILSERIGYTHEILDNLEHALAFFEQSNHLTKELYKDYPKSMEFKNNLAISYSKLGDTHTALGNLEQALIFFEQSNQLGKELYEEFPKDVEYKNNLAISYSRMGDTHTALGNLKQALTLFERYNQMAKELYEDYPINVEFKNGLAISYAKLGHNLQRDLNKSRSWLLQAESLWAELVRDAPQYVQFQQFLAQVRKDLNEME
jgi:tetratricopeptide (TPR) repeat protein